MTSIGKPEEAGRPSKDAEINKLLYSTAKDIKNYIKEIKSQPEDFAHKHLEPLLNSIDRTTNAAVNYVYRKENDSIDFDATFEVLDEALTFLIIKRDREHEKAMADESHIELADEMVIAVNAIQNLVALLSNLRENIPIQAVPLSDESYKVGKKVESATGKKFKDTKNRQ
jgi:hypothetical protein